MQNNSPCVVILGTGGTIAGVSTGREDFGYRAGVVGVDQLVRAAPELARFAPEVEQVAQLDSKDMDHATWQRLAQRAAHHLARTEVVGIVVAHGTDTLEETAWFLQRVLAPAKPVVLTAAMRPASSLQADGPKNLLDAAILAAEPGARGVMAAIAGSVLGPVEVRKRHPYRVDAFDSGNSWPLARIEDGHVLQMRPWPVGEALGVEYIAAAVQTWPRVAIVVSHAGVDEALALAQMRGLLAAGVRGVIVEGTGNGTVNVAWNAAIAEAQTTGVVVWRATRCQGGGLVGEPAGALPSAGELTPARARLELMLRLMKKPSA